MIPYVEQVLNGEILVGKKIKQACQRFKRDIERSKSDDFPYYYDEQQAKKACDFIEMLPKTDGSTLKLEPFQVWIISELFGWRLKDTGTRRYSKCFISVARKNGKTFLIESIAALFLLMEKTPARGRQILFTANSSKQAHLGYDMLKSQLQAASEQSQYIRQRVKLQKQQITDLQTDSFAQALASDTTSMDGYNPVLGIIDEFHESRNKDVFNVLQSGMVQNPNSLLAVISTSGLSLNSAMYSEYKMLANVLNDKVKADRYFVAIWELDDRKEIYDKKNWIKANPLFSNETIKKQMEPALQSDLDLAVKQNNLIPFLVKNGNLWVQAEENSYISADDWDAQTIEEPDLQGKDVYIGVDLSRTNDLTAVSWLVPTGNGQFYADSHAWVGSKYGISDKIKRDGIDYRYLEQKGECTISRLDSGVIDYDDVLNFILDLVNRYNFHVKAVAYDPYSAVSLVGELDKRDYPLEEVRQGLKTLNIPTRDFRDKLYQGKIKHADNELLAYSVNNAIIKVINNGWQIDKARNSNRIDPIAALINAYVSAMDYYDEQEANQRANEYYGSAEFSF